LLTPKFLIAAAVLAAAPVLAGQQREVGVLYGSWPASRTVSYQARLDRPLGAWLRHGVTLHALIERDAAGRDFFGVGYEFQVGRGRTTLAPYAVLGAALGVASQPARQGLAALWSAGAGFEWRPFSFVALAVEERYRVSDRGPRGFWRPGEPHKGWGTSVGLSIAVGSARRRPTRVAAGNEVPTPRATPAAPPLMVVGRASNVVETAIAVLGSPYSWGGTAENGFDCSGLIQYAYGKHGIRLPRTGRAQAVFGTAVPTRLDSLQPGDILAFAARAGGAVTHVGMYVGEGKFIHSSSTGVRLSRLDASDPDGAHWIPRWVGTRRVMP
jgi:cell wall-associated NlpC family hydrolase